jgi:transposase
VYPASTRYDVIRARETRLDAGQIGKLTGVPPRTQRRIVHEEIPFGMSDHELHRKQGVGRPSVLQEQLRREIDALLKEEPAIRAVEVVRRLRSGHKYLAGKNPVYEYLKQVRPPQGALPVVRFEGVAGEFCQHDFGKLTVPYLDGSSEKLIFYAARLKYSRMAHVCLVEGESTEALIRGMESAARAFEGLALINVIDNTKAGVIKRVRDPETGKETIHYQQQFGYFIQEMNLFAEPAYPYSGNQKGAVENLIRFVKESFLLARRFRHRADLLLQLLEWLHYINEQRPCEATGEIPAKRWEVERPRLKPVALDGESYGLPHHPVVGTDAFVQCKRYRYSTPSHWIGQAVLARVHRTTVVLHHNGQHVTHPRLPSNGRYSLLAEHRPAFFVKPRGRVMAKRQILMDLCPAAEDFFTELIHRRPQTWREQDLPIAWELLEKQGEEKTREAFAYCVRRDAIGGEYLRAWAEGVAR